MDSNDVQVVFVQGERGVGKSVLVSRILEDYYKTRSIIWCDIQSDNIWVDLVSNISKLLTIADKKMLNKYLKTTSTHDIEPEQVVEIIDQDLQLGSTILIIDGGNSIDRKSKEVVDLLKFINLLLERSNDLKIILVGRELDLIIKKVSSKLVSTQMLNLEVEGLDKRSSKKILGRNGKRFQAQEFEGIYHHTGGNPLYLDLIRKLDITEEENKCSAEERALLKYMKVVEMLGG
jgi:GTPase SAR1 family protein